MPPAEPAYKRLLAEQRRFTLDEYHRLIEAGVLIDGDPVELLEGRLVPRLKRSPPNANAFMILTKRFVFLLPTGWTIRPGCAVTLTEDSEPEPAVAVVRDGDRSYRDHHPGPSEIGLIAEVADISLVADRHDKGRIYARDRIPTYWVVNVADRQIEVYTQPGSPGDAPAYHHRQDFLPGSLVPVVLDGYQVGTVAVSDLIG